MKRWYGSVPVPSADRVPLCHFLLAEPGIIEAVPVDRMGPSRVEILVTGKSHDDAEAYAHAAICAAVECMGIAIDVNDDFGWLHHEPLEDERAQS